MFLFMILISISFASASPQIIPNNNERINEGASTSQELSKYEKCEIQSYAEDLARLLLSEDINGAKFSKHDGQ